MFLRFYALNEQPFGVTPDPRFLYMGASQQEAFSSLVYGIETGRGFMALIAGPGLGKTTILLRLLERLRESSRSALLFESYTNSLEFLRSLLADLGIDSPGHDMGDLQRQLRNLLVQESKLGKRTVVAIDEAQNLDDEILEMVRVLSNYETHRAKLLQIVLVGQPRLADKLASPQLEQLRQRVSIITHFPPLGAGDIPNYIDHRLRVAGYSGRHLFTPAALRVIETYSQGIPRNINNLCFHALSLGYAKNQKKIDDAILREVVADLSLESLGTASAAARAARNAGTGELREEANIGGRSPSHPANLESMPMEHDRTPILDAVDIFSDGEIGQARIVPRAPRIPPAEISAGHTSSHRGRLLALLGLVALLAYLWRGPRLRFELNYVEHLAKGAATSLKAGGLTTPSSRPELPSAGANLPGDQTKPEGNLPSPAEETARPAPSPEGPAPVESGLPVAAAAGDGSVLPGRPPRTRRPRTPGVQEAHYTRHQGATLAQGRLVVESSIGGARIAIDGRSDPHWTAPHPFALSAGTHVVSVSRAGCLTWTRRVYIDRGQQRWLVAKLEDADEDGGIFTVDTEPPGMLVFIDGRPFGRTRVETVLRPGWHECKVIPGQGLQTLVSRFQLKSGQTVTRRIRIGAPTTSSLKNAHGPGNSGAGTPTVPEGGGTP
jgi:general secretion pathway protein A